MDDRTDIKDFLASRRARITPEQAGLPVYGGKRRVKGLRREEVAMLAGVSVDYYAQLERGRLSGASDSVLDGVARALQLDDAARFVYLDEASGEFVTDWDKAADDIAVMLRAEAGRNPYDRNLTDLIGELCTRSEVFRKRWADHNVRYHRTGVKRLHHPAVGDLELHFEAMTLASDPGLTLLIYTATPGTPSAENLRLLATWAATQDQPEPALENNDHP